MIKRSICNKHFVDITKTMHKVLFSLCKCTFWFSKVQGCSVKLMGMGPRDGASALMMEGRGRCSKKLMEWVEGRGVSIPTLMAYPELLWGSLFYLILWTIPTLLPEKNIPQCDFKFPRKCISASYQFSLGAIKQKNQLNLPKKQFFFVKRITRSTNILGK